MKPENQPSPAAMRAARHLADSPVKFCDLDTCNSCKQQLEAWASVIDREFGQVVEALQEVTDHLARVMGGPLVSKFIVFENGVEGVPTIKKARQALSALGAK